MIVFKHKMRKVERDINADYYILNINGLFHKYKLHFLLP